MKLHYFAIIISLFLLNSCALFKGNKEIESLKFEYSTDATVNYGETLPIRTVVLYKNGKTKNISSKKELIITVKGGIYQNGKIKLIDKPATLQPDTVYVSGVYTKDEKTYTVKEVIPFNYKSDLNIAFRGAIGASGGNGKNRSTPIVFRDGNNGGEGGQGQVGEDGNDLSVNIWKESNRDRYRIKVTNLSTNKVYQYTYKDVGYGIRFDVSGGRGGNGGDGGDGGTGKDGVISEKKTKQPGDGGNGGNGGIGGIGGTGGMVYVFLHPNAKALQNKIAVYNYGGPGGVAGIAGKAGKAGDSAEGQDLAPDGVPGIDGTEGQQGQQGSAFQFSIEDFDIEN